MMLKKEQSVVIPLLKAFYAENIELQHIILENETVRTDMYFSEHKRVVENDKKGHTDRNQNEGNKRQIKIEKHPNCKFFHRISPDAEKFVFFFFFFFEISRIQGCVAKSNKGKLEKEKEVEIKELKEKLEKLGAQIKNQKTKIKN